MKLNIILLGASVFVATSALAQEAETPVESAIEGAEAAPKPSNANDKTLDNETVVMLINAGLGDEAVIAKINSTEPSYQTDVQDLLHLRSRGVSSAVIAAMVSKTSESENKITLSADSPDPTVPHYAGVYVLAGDGQKMSRIDPISSTQIKTGGRFGFAFTYGIASMSIKASFPGETARQSTSQGKPSFYFYFDAANPSTPNGRTNVFGNGLGLSVQSPNEISLVKLKKKKGRREARVGSANIGGAKGGIMDKDQIAFTYEKLNEGVYKAMPNENLDSGEYGFIYTIAGGNGSGVASARVFEFSVK